MRLVDRLLEDSKNIWDSYYEHPFIQGMEKGDLNIKKFRYYLIQDYFYLFQYTKVFAIAILKTEEEDTMSGVSQVIDGILNRELEIHRGYMKRLGITKEELDSSEVALFNKSYTNYMISQSINGDILDTLIAILSCSYSYQLIAIKILEREPESINDEKYGEWIRGYTCDEYIEMNNWLMEKINHLGKDISLEKYKKLKDIFIDCSNYEYEFWDMCYLSEI